MSRGDRSREGARTPEERERDREERARRRALREGRSSASPAGTPAPAAFDGTAGDGDPPAAMQPPPPPPEPAEDVHPDPGAAFEGRVEHRDAPGLEPEQPLEEPLVPEQAVEEPLVEQPPPDVRAGDPPPPAFEWTTESPLDSDQDEPPPETYPVPEDPVESQPAPEPEPETVAAEMPVPRAVVAPVVSARPAASRSVVQPGRSRSRRAPLARLAALVALVAVVVAVVFVVKALHSESQTKLPPAPVVVKVVIPEGETRAQIAEIAKKDGLSGSYTVASRRSSLLSPAHYGAARGTPDLEGFLFPATYDMDARAPASQLVEKQLVAFQENFGASEIARAHALHITPYQLLTVASMVEREAQVSTDRAKIAAVIYNRLHDGMPLGIDASIYYAVELAKGIPTYTHELSEADLHIDSPYNTRIHSGLPPTPISNPGMASIEAAAHPAHVGYLYYVAGADGCGEQVFSTTQAAFEANAAAYQAAVKKNGGRAPTCKHRR